MFSTQPVQNITRRDSLQSKSKITRVRKKLCIFLIAELPNWFGCLMLLVALKTCYFLFELWLEDIGN